MIHETVFRHWLDPGDNGSWMKGNVWGLAFKDKHPESGSKIHDWLRDCGKTGFSGGGSVSYCGRTAQTLVPVTGTSARGGTWPISGASWAGRGGGSSRRQSVLAHCGIRGLNGDCRCRVTSCGRCYHGYFEISRSLDTASVCLTYCDSVKCSNN